MTSELIKSITGTAVTVESFPFIDFSRSVLVVSLAKRAHSFTGRSVHVVQQGHDTVDCIDLHES